MGEINIKIPDLESMKRIVVRLEKSRIITYKDGRKTNSNMNTFIPKDLKDYEGISGVYIICNKENKVVYIGATKNLFNRMKVHSFLRKNPNIKFIYFLKLEEEVKRYVYEILYKYHYFGKVKPEYFGR